MIAHLSGRLVEKGISHCILDVGGVGYLISMSTNSLAALPAEGDEVTVLTHTHVREDELSLFGFENAQERTLFGKLITVSGVGPKVALAALSSFSPEAFVEGVAREDVALVSSVPGVGKKTAQRIILDLKDKLDVPELTGSARGITSDSMGEAREALLSMGFSSAEIASAMKGFEGEGSDTQSVVRHALQRLGGGA